MKTSVEVHPPGRSRATWCSLAMPDEGAVCRSDEEVVGQAASSWIRALKLRRRRWGAWAQRAGATATGRLAHHTPLNLPCSQKMVGVNGVRVRTRPVSSSIYPQELLPTVHLGWTAEIDGGLSSNSPRALGPTGRIRGSHAGRLSAACVAGYSMPSGHDWFWSPQDFRVLF
jgi:hypothetical protein